MAVCARDMKMMDRVMKIALVLCTVFQLPLTVYAFLNDSCYVIENIPVDIRIQNLTETKFSSEIYFPSDAINISWMNDVWEPCEDYNPPLTNNTFQQILVVLNLLHLTNEEISCDQLNRLVHLSIEIFPLDYYHNIGGNVSAINKSSCGSDLERLEIKNSFKSMSKVIRNESFCQFSKLEFLSVVFSDIWEIEEDAFVCLENLIEIDLNWNSLSSLPQRVFGRNQRLQTASFLGNNFNFMVFFAFQPSSNVSVINLKLNHIEVLSEVIPLKRLKRLDVSYNTMRVIHRNAFSELLDIESINLAGNRLGELHAETFRNNAEIKILTVEQNALKSVPKINHLSKLEALDLSSNQITSINWSDLFDNRIDGTSKIKSNNLSINFSNNRVQSLSNVRLPGRVSNFDVRNNQIESVCSALLRFIPILSEAKNVLQLAGNPLRCNCVNRELKLPYYQTLISDFADIECELLNQRVKLAELEDDGNLCRIEYNSSDQCVCVGNDDCSSNPLHGRCYVLTDAFKSKIIHVCENLTEIPTRGYYTDLFRLSKHHLHFKRNNIEKLKLVHFDDEKLSEQCVSFYLENSNVRIIENDAFNRVTNLEILSLRSNRIRVLPDNLFQNLTKLKELYLSNNRLITLTGQTIINNVIKLELHNNSLTHLPITNTNQLLLSSSNLTNLSLHDNPWSCECEFIQPFHNYLVNNINAIQQAKDINCTDEQRRKYNAIQFDLSKCKPFLYLTAVVTSTTFAVVIITIAALIFIYRREVRVLVYSRFRLRIFGSEVDDDVTSKQYDAFVAYNSKDEDFLVNHLMPGLEAIPNPYRLCIHERDFPAGAFIQESIMRAVQLSSRTIVLLSENFVDSGWCRMEFMMAHAQMMEDRCPRVLLIVLGEIPQNLDPEMELYLRTNTYLKWGERLFWEKLYYAMPDQRVTSPATDIMPMYQL